MDKTCSIVQDLLPLYEEDMLREETKEFVDGHLAQCAACRAELDVLKADVKPAPVSGCALTGAAAARLEAAASTQEADRRAAGRHARADAGDGGIRVSHRAAVFAVQRDRVGDLALAQRARGRRLGSGWAF